MVVDQAGSHMAKDVVIPEGIDLFELPSHSRLVTTSRTVVAVNQ
ncbi:hypothetical protein [Zarconia navalis]|nr:hypothetical protein [Zarconia navalis]